MNVEDSMPVKIRKGHVEELESIMACFDRARQFMRSQGNYSQWINGYPSRELILDDINQGRCYVGTDTNEDIVMVFSFVVGADPTYTIIEEGHWLNDNVYGTIHRLASNGKYSGILDTCVKFCQEFVNDLRLDTHENNKTMRNAAERAGFIRCGKIYCYDGTPRIAYHKSIKQ